MAKGVITEGDMEDLQVAKVKLLEEFLEAQPPTKSGEDLFKIWSELYDEGVKNTVVKCVNGPSDDEENPVMPYEKLQSLLHDYEGCSWKWPRMWQHFDEIERRGECFREGEALNFGMPNKNPNIISQRVLVVGGGPIGLRLAIELQMGGHLVTLFEKRREKKDDKGNLTQLGFTNRINRPHMWPFVRNDLQKLNGKDLMSRQAAYPVFTEPETSSIGIDELQCLLIKNALLLGVDMRLGVGYVNAKVKTEDGTARPFWDVECSVDQIAAQQYNMEEGKTHLEFDCLVGCDGPRSAVRETQQKYFGKVEKRKFMDCVGIVANVQKLSRTRLKQLGFEHGQEPGDMNRTKMVFKEFFGKIQEEADADIENLIYYKASSHNYTILVPKRADLIKHGLSGKVYTFHSARDSSGKQDEEKEKLKKYCKSVLQAAGIPVDDEASNGGFVGVPNDCMAFDFAECWNMKKSLVFNLPPPDYDEDEDGPWSGRKLVPLVALAGDALLEPFWPMGLGLKRGWQAMLDTCFAIDNLYNRTFYAQRKGVPEDEFQWEEHFEAHKEQCSTNFEMCNRLQVTKELGAGEYDDKSEVMTMLKKYNKDAEKPMYCVEIDPWTRYEPMEREVTEKRKKMTKAEREENMPYIVNRTMAIAKWYSENTGGKDNALEYEGKALVSINGKEARGWGKHGKRKSVTKAAGKEDKPKKKPGAAPGGARKKKGAVPKDVPKEEEDTPAEPESKKPTKEQEEALKKVRERISQMSRQLEVAQKTEKTLVAAVGE